MLIGYIFFSIIFLVFMTFLFKRAAGTLSIFKLNIISFTYYYLLFFTVIGSLIILFGYRDHYMVEMIASDSVIIRGCLYLAYGLIMLPIAIRLFTLLFCGREVGKLYEEYLKEEVQIIVREDLAFWIIFVFSVLCALATAWMFCKIGSIPVLDVLRSHEVNSLTRANVTNSFAGNTLIRNTVVLFFTPLLSYITYIYFRISKKRKLFWFILFLFDAALAVLIKTYNLEKAPVILWCFYFYLIEILLGNNKVNRILIILGGAAVLLVLFMYSFSEDNTVLLSLRNGPLARVLITQPSTFFLHIQAFPNKHPFLEGASLPTAVSWLSKSGESWVRSGRIVMGIYNPRGVRLGVAGVMNALFLGEAYANWGLTGVLFAPFIVALPFAITYSLLLRLRKTALTMVIYLTLFSIYTGCIHGGFVDYIYNSSVILVIFAACFLVVFLYRGVIRIKRLRK